MLGCTLWTVPKEGGGRILVKQRDEFGGYDKETGEAKKQSLVLVRPADISLFMYVALASQENAKSDHVLRGGLNEHGLAAENAWAGTAKKWPGFIHNQRDGEGFMHAVLTEFTSVHAVLAALPRLVRLHNEPEHYIIGDRDYALIVEVHPGGTGSYTAKFIDIGEWATHSNHYGLSPDCFNTWKPDSPYVREAEIKAALEVGKKHWTLEDHIVISHRQLPMTETDWQHNSLFRVGNLSDPCAARTLASLVIEIGIETSRIYLQCHTTRSKTDPAYILTLQQAFWDMAKAHLPPGSITVLVEESADKPLAVAERPETHLTASPFFAHIDQTLKLHERNLPPENTAGRV